MSGAAPLGAELAERGRRAARRADVIQGYGMTETSPVTHVDPTEPERTRPARSARRSRAPSAGSSIPETGEDVGEGERGELWVRGPQVMQGYLNNEEATAHTIDADGWLHTGDIAVIDDDGYFEIVDRLKELIKYKGFQVAARRARGLILITHPGGRRRAP